MHFLIIRIRRVYLPIDIYVVFGLKFDTWGACFLIKYTILHTLPNCANDTQSFALVLNSKHE